MINIQPVILAGGSGTRLWPLSRSQYPKQLLKLTDDYSMLQNTLLRLKDQVNLAKPILVINKEHKYLISSQLEELEMQAKLIILEPFGRNTAPATLLSSLLTEQEDNTVIALLPADHYIGNIKAFHQDLIKAAICATNGNLVMFGITPNTPHTGYGYIKVAEKLDQDAFKVKQFIEKPALAEVKKYIEAGGYYWNSGIFVFTPELMIREVAEHEPELVQASKDVLRQSSLQDGYLELEPESFKKCINISIDYAVMEYTQRAAVIPAAFSWSDVGNWGKLWEICEKDENNNVQIGDVISHNVKNSYIHATKRLVAAQNLQDLIVVETADAVYIGDRNSVENMKQLTSLLEAKDKVEFTQNIYEYRPWGHFERIDCGENFLVKRLTINPQAKLSLQIHKQRAEHWVVVKGIAKITRGDETIILQANESTYIPENTAHRIENPDSEPLIIIEIQSGSYIGEDDIIRLEDSYNRITQNKPVKMGVE